MARPLRLSIPGELHYVVLRSHNDQMVFQDDRDCVTFLAQLRAVAPRYEVAVHAYALTTSQVHLLATPASAGSLGRLMQSLGRSYVADFNRRHGRTGTLWSGRFRAALIDGVAHGHEALVFVESQSARIGLCPSNWPWSSSSHHVGTRRDPLITEHPSYWSIGNTPFERELAHAIAFGEGPSKAVTEAFDNAVHGGRILGSEAFRERIQTMSTLDLGPKRRGRPKHLRD